MFAALITLAEEATFVTAPVMALFMSAYGAAYMVIGPVAGIALNASVISYPAMLLGQALAGLLLFVVYLAVLRWLKISGHGS